MKRIGLMTMCLTFLLFSSVRRLSSSPADMDQDLCLCKFVAPIYSPLARTVGMQGLVRVKVDIASEGVPTDVTVVSGEPVLSGSALDAIKGWRFCSRLAQGQKREIVVTFTFTISKSKPPTQSWAPTEVSFDSPASVTITAPTATGIKTD